MPVYNPDPAWLRRAIQSVGDQAYPHWELCIADDCSTRPDVRPVLEEAARNDPRIQVVYRHENGHISQASNTALDLASGTFVAFLDHDDWLPPEALYEVASVIRRQPDIDIIYSDEDKMLVDGKRWRPLFKPDWSPELLLSVNYMSHLTVIRKSLISKVGGFRDGYEGAQDYDLLLRATELTENICHIPKVLYTWCQVAGSAALYRKYKPYAFEAGRRALEDALRRRRLPGSVTFLPHQGTYRTRLALRAAPRVSIIIPTRDRADLLRACINSIEAKTTYQHYQLFIVDNDSVEDATIAYLCASRHTVIRYPGPFNYARMMNVAARQCTSEYLLFLNNDTMVITPDWLEALLEHAQNPTIGIVGARLLFPDGRPQHEGISVGVGGFANNSNWSGHPWMSACVRNTSAVTGACMMMRRETFDTLRGFDENLTVAWNDVDLCLRAAEVGLRVVYTPYACLYHHEGASRGRKHPREDDVAMSRKWGKPGDYRDPYVNPNFHRDRPCHLRLYPGKPERPL